MTSLKRLFYGALHIHYWLILQIFGFLITVERLIGKRMMLADKLMQSFLKHMRIDLRR